MARPRSHREGRARVAPRFIPGFPVMKNKGKNGGGESCKRRKFIFSPTYSFGKNPAYAGLLADNGRIVREGATFGEIPALLSKAPYTDYLPDRAGVGWVSSATAKAGGCFISGVGKRRSRDPV